MRRVITQNTKELIGRRVRQEMEKQGLSQEELAKRAKLRLGYLTQLLEGQPLWLSHTMMVNLAKALNLHEARGGKPFHVHCEDLTDADLESLFYPPTPEQLEMEFDNGRD